MLRLRRTGRVIDPGLSILRQEFHKLLRRNTERSTDTMLVRVESESFLGATLRSHDVERCHPTVFVPEVKRDHRLSWIRFSPARQTIHQLVEQFADTALRRFLAMIFKRNRTPSFASHSSPSPLLNSIRLNQVRSSEQFPPIICLEIVKCDSIDAHSVSFGEVPDDAFRTSINLASDDQ